MTTLGMKTTGMIDARAKSKERLRKALIKAKGNRSVAAELLGCSRKNVEQMVGRDQSLQDLCNELMDGKLDLLEDKLYELGADGTSVTAAIAMLNTYGKSRGWSYNRTDVNVSGHVTHGHFHLHANLGEASQRLAAVSDDQLAAMIEQRRAAEDEGPKMIDITPSEGG